MILRRFSPTFTMKSVLTGGELLLVGVNMKGHEVFTYVVHSSNDSVQNRLSSTLLNTSKIKETKSEESEISDPDELLDE